MKLIKFILFVIGVILALIVVIIAIITLKTLVEYVLTWLGVPNIGQSFRIDDVYNIMTE